MTNRIINLMLAVVLLSSVFGTGIVAAASPSTGVQYQQDNTTVTPVPNPDGRQAPTSAETARITPVDMGLSFLTVEVRESDTAFNTSGPFAQFRSSEAVESVRIQQSPADASLVGGQVIMISYDEDAAPLEQPSLYTLEIYFEDGSSKTVDLYATNTGVEVTSGDESRYRDLLVRMTQDAEEHGYETDPEGLEEYYTWRDERADILDSIWSEKAVQAVTTVIMWVTNPVALFISLLAVIAGMYWRIKTHGWALDNIRNDPGRATRKLRELKLAYQENQDNAASERISNIPEIGADERKWRASHGVATVAQVADLFRNGAWDADGNKIHDGVEDLRGNDPHDTWLEPILRDGRLSNPEIPLVQGIKALERMETKYGMGHAYRGTREELDKYLSEVQNKGLQKPA